MDDRTQGALLLAVGGVALRLGLTDAALAYVKAGLQPLLVATGVVLVVLGAIAVVKAFRNAVPSTPESHLDDDAQPHDLHGHFEEAPVGHGHAHGHEGHGPAVAWLLVLPLLAVLLVAPPPLGAFAASRQSALNPVTTQTSYPPLPEPVNGAVELTMSEYVFRALYDKDRSLAGATIRLTGFAAAEPDGQPGEYRLSRFVLNCCAADGRAVSVTVRGDDTPRAPDTWLQVVGTWEERPDQDTAINSTQAPLFIATSVTPIEQPDQPYEY